MPNYPNLKDLFSQGASAKSPVFKAPKITAPITTTPKPSPVTRKIAPAITPEKKGWDAMSAWDRAKAFVNEIPSATWKVGKDIASGFVGSTSAMLSGGEWATKKIGAPSAISDVFKGTGDMTNEWAKELAPKNPIFADKLIL